MNLPAARNHLICATLDLSHDVATAIDAPQIAALLFEASSSPPYLMAAQGGDQRGRRHPEAELRNGQAPTSIFSRRSATSQRMVASDPVTDRFGPRSTPNQNGADDRCGQMIAAATESRRRGRPAGCCRCSRRARWHADAPGRRGTDCATAWCSSALSCAITPVLIAPPPYEDLPTSGSTLQDTPAAPAEATVV